MELITRRLRTPEERVGVLPNGCLPPPHGANPPSADEALLEQALRHGDEKAFAHILDVLFAPMLRVAMRHVDSRATAEDIVQETWLAALRGIDRFEGRSSIKTWLFNILRNIARTRGRRDARMRPFSELDGAADESADAPVRTSAPGVGERAQAALWMRSADDPQESALSAELATHIERAIATLPKRQQEIIRLRDVEGWTAEEVCNVMEISQTNQRVLLHRARDRVRNQLHDYLADTHACSEGIES